jgi:iterative type I PKS product template protein
MPVPGINCGNMEVFKPLILKDTKTETRVLEISVEADLNQNQAQLRFLTVDNASNQSTLHATCMVAYEDKAAWIAGWDSMRYLIEGRIETLKDRLAKNHADKLSRKLAYKLFSSFVDYKPAYQGMEEVIVDGSSFEATSCVKFQTQDKDESFFCCPYWIDSLAHLSGFVLNGSGAVDTNQFVYISHGWKALQFAVPLERNKTYHAYVKMQKTAESNMMAGDVYIFENNVIIGICIAIKFQRIPRTVLNSFLPPQPSAIDNAVRPKYSAPVDKVTILPATVASKVALGTKRAKSNSKALLSSGIHLVGTDSVVAARVLDIISSESELPLSELQDECSFASLGVDSLLSLQILGRIRESLDLDLPGSVFLDCQTIGELKSYLSEAGGCSGSSTTTTLSSILSDDEDALDSSSVSSTESLVSVNLDQQGTHQLAPPSRPGDLLMLFRETISEQMDIDVEEVVGSNDLLSLGMDSLMSICILGIIREKTELDLESDFFLAHSSVDSIEQFLNSHSGQAEVEPQPRTTDPKKVRRSRSNIRADLSPTPLPRAVSVFMQGRTRTATKKLFLFPDGSGSATSYSSIPAIDPSTVVYGLNCPYMTTPELFTNGIPGVASQYLAEVRHRQPKGPYHLGGWSAGGVIAFEITLQLLAAGETVNSLILLDSPCPIGLEPLPPRLHHFFAEIGIIGSEQGTKVPTWLLPHFEATIKALTAYKPQPIPAAAASRAPRTLSIWARHGVCRYPDSPRPAIRGDEPKSMNWLLNNRTDFGPNGWERLLGNGEIKTMSLDGNHFTLMKGKEQVRNTHFN